MPAMPDLDALIKLYFRLAFSNKEIFAILAQPDGNKCPEHKREFVEDLVCSGGRTSLTWMKCWLLSNMRL